jgi:hypothetical protein
LKATVVAMGLGILTLCIYILPAAMSTNILGEYRPIVWGMYVTAIPFFVAIYQALKLLNYIDTNKAFSDLSVTALKYIKYCAIAIGSLYTVGMPYIYLVADRDDAPGVIVIGLVFIFASLAVATLSAVLQRLLQNAIVIKSENDLTV